MIEYLKVIREEWPQVKAAKWVIFISISLGLLAGYEFSEFSGKQLLLQKDANSVSPRANCRIQIQTPGFIARGGAKTSGEPEAARGRPCLGLEWP